MQSAYNKMIKKNIRLEVDYLFYNILYGIQENTKKAYGKRIALSQIILHFCAKGIENESNSPAIMYKTDIDNVQKKKIDTLFNVKSEHFCTRCSAFDHEKIKTRNLEDDFTEEQEKFKTLQNEITLKEEKINFQMKENLKEKEELLQLKEQILNKMSHDVQQHNEIELLNIKLDHANDRYKQLMIVNQDLKDTNREQYSKTIHLLEKIERSTR